MTQLCYVFDGLLSVLNDVSVKFEEDEDATVELKTTRPEALEAMYIQACYWSLGATLIAEDKIEFDDYMKKTAGFMLVQDTPEKPATVRKLITASN